jgi:hypothetical protein
MAAGALVSSSVAASESAVGRFAPKVAPTITITIVSASPQPPNAGEQFEFVARVGRRAGQHVVRDGSVVFGVAASIVTAAVSATTESSLNRMART